MFETVKNEDFMILSVAMDADVEAARPWIEAVSPDFITFVDQKSGFVFFGKPEKWSGLHQLNCLRLVNQIPHHVRH